MERVGLRCKVGRQLLLSCREWNSDRYSLRTVVNFLKEASDKFTDKEKMPDKMAKTHHDTNLQEYRWRHRVPWKPPWHNDNCVTAWRYER